MVALTYGQRPPKPQNSRGRSWGRKQWPLDPPVAHFEDRGTLNIQMLCTRPEHEHEHVWHAPYKAMGDCGGSCVPAVVAYFGKAAKNVVDPALVIPLLLEAPNALLRSLALEGVTVASTPPSLDDLPLAIALPLVLALALALTLHAARRQCSMGFTRRPTLRCVIQGTTTGGCLLTSACTTRPILRGQLLGARGSSSLGAS